MRYKLLILLLSLGCIEQLGAQVKDTAQDQYPVESPLNQQNINTDEKLKTRLGVKFTLGGHTFRGTAFDKEKALYGFGAGMFQVVNLNKKKTLQLQWELNLTFKGSKFSKPTDTSNTFFSKISLSYAELPVFLSFKLDKSKNPSYLLIGGQFGFLFKSSITQGLGQYGEVLHNGLPFKKYDFSPALGLRKELGSGISMQFTGKYGMTNIYSGKFDPAVTPDYKDVFPRFKDGAHDVHNLSFELAFLFGI
jgi:hypothetical protein